ncbi:MAG: DUF2804 domain-containing protein [Traorella sp.]
MIEITQRQKLLNEQGNIQNPGYAKKMLWEYNRNDIKASKSRIKEWDYYLIVNEDIGVALTMDDNSYMGLMSISLLDFKNKREKTVSQMFWLPFGKLHFPSNSSEGKIEYHDHKCNFSFETKNNIRMLHANMKNFVDHQDVDVNFVLTGEPEESMVIATPFEKEKHFYYNQKINCMRAQGKVVLGEKEIIMDKTNTFATLDWGRGVWTYRNTWYWGSGSGVVLGHDFGFNLGYGFGDTSNATENMLFYDGKAHKLEHVMFHIPMKDGKEDYLKEWDISSSDNRFEMKFKPILDRKACSDVKIIKSDQHQVFGYFSGKAILDDGQEILVKDFLGFCEKVENKW